MWSAWPAWFRVSGTVVLMVLTLSGGQVSAMTRFDASTLPRFGLPVSLGY